MSTSAVIDIASLLHPISEESPAGSDIRDDTSPNSIYFRLKDARQIARAAERSMDADAEDAGLLPEWRTILELSPKVLTEQAKDLEVAAWYTEALLRSDGFAGLRDGFWLLAGLVRGFWDGLYPLPDEDGLETKVAPLTGLNGDSGEGALIQPIRKVPLSQGQEFTCALWHYTQACDLARVSDAAKRQARIDSGVATMDAVQQSARQTPAPFFVALRDELDACIQAFKELGDVLYEKAGHDAPPAGNIRDVLQAARDAVADIGRDKLAAADARAAGGDDGSTDTTVGLAVAPAAAAGASFAGATASVPMAGGVLASREQAFAMLLQIADFFRKTEPHSPISYTLEELVRRGRMSLPELLKELIQDDTTRNFFFTAAGIKPPTEEAGSADSGSGW